MQINSVNSNQNPSFQSAYLTLSEKNLGKHIEKHVVEAFNKNLLPVLKDSVHLNKFKGIAETSDFWALGGGEGSRFRPLARAFTSLTGIPANKISFPIPLNEKVCVHMSDWALAAGAPFAQKDGGIIPVVEPTSSGLFCGIIKHYTNNPAKNVIIHYGDNVFNTKQGELMTFAKDVIENPNLRLGHVGVKRTPEDTANVFGIYGITKRFKNSDDIYHTACFVNKPEIEIAKKMVTPEGYCPTNTGFIVFKKEAIEELLKALKENPDLIKRNDIDIYDCAKAADWAKRTFGPERSVVKALPKKTWEDVGSPTPFFKFLNRVKKDEFLNEFGDLKSAIQKSVNNRFWYSGNRGELLLDAGKKGLNGVNSRGYPVIDGVKIIA
ncbi:MAG: hypothetical protein LBJ74_06060 [Heliobacteriaceae bacterium]|nr:hypothetical protein [Heliobacteriaceae bacterium]